MLDLKLMLETPWIGFAALVALFLLGRAPRFPGSAGRIGNGGCNRLVTGGVAPTHEGVVAPNGLHLMIPTWTEAWRSLGIAVLPHLSLTLTMRSL